MSKNKAKAKGKRDSISDKNAIPEEIKLDSDQSQKKQVIFDETIAKLQITEEDLNALMGENSDSESRSSSAASKSLTKVAVRKEIPPDKRKPPTQNIHVLRKAPANAPVRLPEGGERNGPRHNQTGDVVPHSILGSLHEYYRLGLEKGDIEAWEIPRDIRQEVISQVKSNSARSKDDHYTYPVSVERHTTNRLPVTPRELSTATTRPLSAKMSQTNMDADFAALKNWENKMQERKRVQGHISNLLHRPQDQLIMNSGEKYRAIQEERYLIDRTLAFYEKGKGFRVGSEFWKELEILRKQPNPDEELHITLTRTEMGYPPSIEHVGIPMTIKEEKGIDWEPTKKPSYPWSFPFYKQRRELLEKVIHELDPYTPQIDFLQVVGHSVSNSVTHVISQENITSDDRGNNKENTLQYATTETTVMSYDGQERNTNQTDRMTDTMWQKNTVIGPSLLIGGSPICWEGNTNSQHGSIRIDARVIFQSFTREKCVQHLNIVNNGTTAVYYKWKRLPRSNPFELVQPHVKRFYFDIQGGVLLPKETLEFPFIFKCDTPGIYTEQWHIETVPVLGNGALLLVTLRGIAQQEDFYAVTRAKIQADLSRQVSERMVLSILEELLHGIKESERPVTPLDAYLTEEDQFKRMNPELAYSINNKKTLTKVFSECFPKEERESVQWNSSISDIRNRILRMGEAQSTQLEENAKKLYSAVNGMIFPIVKPFDNLSAELHHLGYHLLCNSVDDLFTAWNKTRNAMDLTEFEVIIPDPNDKSKKSARDGRSKAPGTTRGAASQSPGKVSRSDTKVSGSKTAATKPSSGGNRRSSAHPQEAIGVANDGSLISSSGTSLSQMQQNQSDDLGRNILTGEESTSNESAEMASELQQQSREALCTKVLHQMTYAWLYEFTGQLADLMIATEEDYLQRGIDIAPPSMSLFTL